MTQYRTFSLKRKQQLLFLLDEKRVFHRTYPSANPTLYLTVNFCWVREVVGAQLLTEIDQKPQRLHLFLGSYYIFRHLMRADSVITSCICHAFSGLALIPQNSQKTLAFHV